MSDQEKNQDPPEEANAEEVTENETAEEDVSENEDAAQTTETSSDGAEDMTEEEIADLKDKLLRTLADMENLRRRSQKDWALPDVPRIH